MDAKARRMLWNDIISLIKENRIVILTSHSMEECEALCTRLVIMVNGQFKCLGSPQHLKTKFGSGYKLAIRLDDVKEKDSLFKFMKENFPTSIMQESHKNLFEFILPFGDTRLSEIFGKIEKNRDRLSIKDYSLSQTTLDQVFINFARLQNEEPFTEMDGKVNENSLEAAATNIYKMVKSNSVNEEIAAAATEDERKEMPAGLKEKLEEMNRLESGLSNKAANNRETTNQYYNSGDDDDDDGTTTDMEFNTRVKRASRGSDQKVTRMTAMNLDGDEIDLNSYQVKILPKVDHAAALEQTLVNESERGPAAAENGGPSIYEISYL
jgi:hypothetical protein